MIDRPKGPELYLTHFMGWEPERLEREKISSRKKKQSDYNIVS